MKSQAQVILPQDSSLSSLEEFAQEVQRGLSATPKNISAAYLYDNNGDRLFQKIMDMPEYYLTNCEFEIIESHKEEIATHLKARPFRLIELGAGDGRKTEILLRYFNENDLAFEYIPIDISHSAIQQLMRRIHRKFPKIKSRGVVSDYKQGLESFRLDGTHNLILFMGSSLGNFTIEQAIEFCSYLSGLLSPGDKLLLGLDLAKDPAVLLQAYDDPAGITKQFNLNLLQRINQELGGHFRTEYFSHHASYNPQKRRMESYLLSRKKQSIMIEYLKETFQFEAWESLHTEYSYKYTQESIESLARKCNLDIIDTFKDSKEYYANVLCEVRPRV